MSPEGPALALTFQQVRDQSPQWQVTFEGRNVALVTLRYIAQPPYAVVYPDGREEYFETREDVVMAIQREVRK